MYKLLFVCAFATIISLALGSSCSNPVVESGSTYTTQDATIVNQIAFIRSFGLNCDGKAPTSQLFAVYDGKVTPVVRTGTNQYQVSWTEEPKKARRGVYTIRILDEESFAAFRKAQRSSADTSSIPALAELSLSHPGAFNGPYVNSEILAAGLSLVVAYVAFSTKSKLLS